MGRAKILVIDHHTYLFERILSGASHTELQFIHHQPEIDTNDFIVKANPQLIILGSDLVLSDQVNMCRRIRSSVLVPIIVIDANGSLLHEAFEAGANDFVKQPVDITELLFRVNRLLGEYRKECIAKQFSLHYTDLSIYLISQSVHHKERNIELSSQEFKLLTYLAYQPTRISSSEQLYKQIWGAGNHQDVRTVLVHISNIRRKLAQENNLPPYIQTIRGIGYKFHEYYL